MGIKDKKTTNTAYTTSSTGQAQVGDVEGVSQNLTGVTLGEGASLSLLDQGSIARAFDFAASALGFAEAGNNRQADAFKTLSNEVSETTDRVARAFETATGSVNAERILLAVLGAAVIGVGFYAFRRS